MIDVAPVGLSRPARMGLAGLILAIVTAAAARLHFGVDFTDEAFYATLPYRFALGDRPYVSDLGVAQNAGILTTPIVWLWLSLTGDGGGLIVFLRYAYLGMRVCVCVLAAWALWRRAPRGLGVVTPLLVCGFVLFAIPTLSYNTIAASAVTASLLFLLLWVERGTSAFAAATVVCAAIAAYVHPGLSLVATAIVTAVVVCAPNGGGRRVALRALVGVGVALAVVGIVAALGLGAANIKRLLAEAGAYAGPSVMSWKLLAAPGRLLSMGSGRLLALIWLGLWFASRLPRAITAVMAAAYVLLAASMDNQFALILIGIAALPLAWRVWRYEREADLLLAASLSVVAGLTVAQFSTNGIPNGAVGMETAAMIFFIALHRVLVAPAIDDRWWNTRLTKLPAVLAILTVIRFSSNQWTYVYRDDHISRLVAAVPEGPYKWLRTTPAKLTYLVRVQSALRNLAAEKQSLLVFNGFPGAYLMAAVPPATPITWVAAGTEAFAARRREGIARALGEAARPMLVMQVFRLPVTATSDDHWEYTADDPLVRAVMSFRPRVAHSTPDYVLYEVTETKPVLR